MTTIELKTIAQKLNKEIFIQKIYSIDDRMSIRFNEKTENQCEPEKYIFSLESSKNVFINFVSYDLNDDYLSFDSFYSCNNGKSQNSFKRYLTFLLKYNS